MADNSGYVYNDKDYGSIFIGKDDKSGKTDRIRQVQVASASLASIKLYDDGGFEISSSKGDKEQKADSIFSQSQQGLHIISRGSSESGEIVIDAGPGTIRLVARDIVLEATGSESGGISLFSNNNITIDAADNIGIEGSQVAIGAKYRMLVGTAGPFILRGKGGVNIVEPKTKLIPTTISSVVDSVLNLVFPEYF